MISGADIQEHGQLLPDRSEQDSPVVGYIGSTVPVEVIEAAGFTPVAVSADDRRAIGPGAELFEEEFPHEQRLIADAIARGRWSFVRCLVIDRSHSDLFYYLSELTHETGYDELPPVIPFDLVTTRESALMQFNHQQLVQLDGALSYLSGGSKPHDLDAAIEEWNTARSLIERLDGLRRERRLPGSHLFSVLLNWQVGPAGNVIDLLERAVALVEAGRLEEATGVPVLLVASEPLRSTELHESIEEAGGFVVGEDDPLAPQQLAIRVPATDDPLAALAQRYARHAAVRQMHPFTERNDWLLHAAVDRANGVVFLVSEHDRRLGWDVPRLRADLEARGLPSTVVRVGAADERLPSPELQRLTSEIRAWR